MSLSPQHPQALDAWISHFIKLAPSFCYAASAANNAYNQPRFRRCNSKICFGMYGGMYGMSEERLARTVIHGQVDE